MMFSLLLALNSCSPESKALKNFKYGNYENVISYYQNVLKSQPNNGKANYYIAESYRQSNRIKQSEPYYEKAGGPGVNKDSVLLYLAKAQQANGKYAEAVATLETLQSSTEVEGLRDRAGKELAGLQNLEDLKARKNYYRVKNLETLNSTFSEYSPAYLNGELYFTSSRSNDRIYGSTGTPFTDIFKASTQGANVDVETIKPLPESINTPNVNVGTIAFSPDGKTMVFAKGNTGKRKGANDVDLFLSRFRNSQWTEPQQININQPDSWESAPAFSPDGRHLYFASNRKGGYGGLDLYSAQMDSRGRFTRVRNLGPEINTSGNESFPHIAENGKMYFSSDGHPGYGMLDIFVVNRVNGKTSIDNLGQPVNSTGDDFGIFLFKIDRGFFTSNRDGGKGDDDIYTFINEDPDLKVVNYNLQGIAYSMRPDSTRDILPETKVTLLDSRGDIMQDFVTGSDGKFIFRVYENEKYTLIGEASGYLVKRGPYQTIGKSVDPATLKELVTTITLDTLLVLDRIEKNKVFVLKNIYFGLDSANIRPQSARELDKLVDVLNDNPEIKIEMSSHTDSIGSVEYNINLSQRRAAATVNYLIKKGIAAERLVAKGYGESKPIARNTNPDGSDNPEGRQRNRRTEFKILEIGIRPVKEDDEDDEDKFFKKGIEKEDDLR
ncbi:MAG: PD40 domain-containing protein [Cyclobacteriaceae bacterium]|nr:PD40 domain-containing protein [Cyclobacteriaceae bacterium]